MVVEGVLEKISGGSVISSAGTGAYTTEKLGRLYKTKTKGQDIHAGGRSGSSSTSAVSESGTWI